MTNPDAKVGVLSTLSFPLLPLYLKGLVEANVRNICVIFDKSDFSEKNRKIFQERTEGAFDQLSVSLYDFSKNPISFYFVGSHNGAECIDLIKSIGVSVLINAGTPRKLGSSIIDSVSQGIINVHPGVLPKYRGSCCVEWAILNDDPVGNTAHFMSTEYDAGPIIEVEEYCFPSDATYASIRVKVYQKAVEMMARVVQKVLVTGMSPGDGYHQGHGELHQPVTDDQVREIKEKIRTKAYKYLS